MMTKPTTLEGALHRNRQRLALEKLKANAEWMLREAGEILPPEVSRELDAELRAMLRKMRPAEQGTLFVTPDAEALRGVAGEYFAGRPGRLYALLLAHWVDAGAMVFTSDVLVGRIGDLLEFDGDTVYGCREDRSEVFVADRTIGDGGVTFEFFWFVSPDE